MQTPVNNHNLRIQATESPTVLEKLLQVTRYRGFKVTGMTMFSHQKSEAENNNENNSLDIVISIQSQHSIGQLTNQLNKLIDIEQITIEDEATNQCLA
jgi:acetolactate synthase II small subunit